MAEGPTREAAAAKAGMGVRTARAWKDRDTARGPRSRWRSVSARVQGNFVPFAHTSTVAPEVLDERNPLCASSSDAMTETTELTFSVYEDIKLEPLADPMYRQLQSLVKGSGRPGDGCPSVFPTLAPIAGMTRLHTLDLAFETTLGDISTVADLPALRVLRLGSVTGDLAPIGQCRRLTALALQSASLRDLSLFTPLSDSLEGLTISGERLTDFSALSAFGRLRELSVYGSPVSALPLHGLTELRTLNVGLPNLTELPGLGDVTALLELSLAYSSRFPSLLPFAGMTGLRSLNVANLALLGDKDFDTIGRFNELRTLTLWDTKIRSLAPITSLSNLESLNVYGCPISRKEILRALPLLGSLKSLWCTAGDAQTLDLRKRFPELRINNYPPLSQGASPDD